MEIASVSRGDCVWQPSFLPSVCFDLVFVANAALVSVFFLGMAAGACLLHIWQNPQKPTAQSAPHRHNPESGNVFFALFAAMGMVGVIGAASMTILGGPVKTMSTVTHRTIAENNLMTAGKLAIIATSKQTGDGDCDGDGIVEPITWNPTGTGPKPAGGGYLPSNLGATLQDPWQTVYGFCAWDHGSQIQTTCPTPTLRLRGIASTAGPIISIISAGPDRVFQTTCANAPAYVTKPPGSDDILMTYTYAEARAIAMMSGGGGLWSLKEVDMGTAEIAKNLEVKNSGGNVVFGVDSSSDPAKPSIKVDFISKLSDGKPAIELISNLMLGTNWLSGDGGNEGLRIGSTGVLSTSGDISAGGAVSSNGALAGFGAAPRDGTGDSWIFYNPSGNDMRFWRNTGGDALTITQAGNVGIGTTAPTLRLDVNGAARASGEMISNSANAFRMVQSNYGVILRNDGANTYFLLTNSGDPYGTWNALRPFSFANTTGNVTLGHHLAVGGNVTAAAFFHSSDRNLKTGITDIDDPFDLLAGITGKHYTWKESGKQAYGVIAQDVEAVMPEAVGQNGEGFKTVEYDQLIPVLVEAVKQLEDRNDELRFYLFFVFVAGICMGFGIRIFGTRR